MSGRHAFDELTKDFTPERRARVEARKSELRTAMLLDESRETRVMTRKAAGEILGARGGSKTGGSD